MLGEFKLSKSISKFFGDAYDLFQLGSSVVDALDSKNEDESGFIPKRAFNFDSSLRSARPTAQVMQAPIGLKGPNLQSAFRYFANNTARDVNLASVAAKNYRASLTRKRQNVTPNIAVGSFGSANMASARSNRVARTRFRSHLNQ